MRAIIQHGYGGPADLEVRDVPTPEPGPAEVLVRVSAASLHPDVWHVVAGRPRVLRLMGAGLRRPRIPIPGLDVAGVVAAAGPGATRFRPGDAVFGETIRSHQWVNGGAFAEYVAVPEPNLAAKPANASFEQAATLPTAGYITLLNLRSPERWRGRRALVNGAAGGVGSLALQILKAHGAHVTAVDGPDRQDLLLRLGADRVLDYTRDDFTHLGERWDLVFDVPGNHPFRRVRRVLEPGGRYVIIGHDAYGAAGGQLFGQIPRFLGLMALALVVPSLRAPRDPAPTRESAIETLRALLEAGAITPVVHRAYPLEQVREAFRAMMSGGAVGRVVLTP